MLAQHNLHTAVITITYILLQSTATKDVQLPSVDQAWDKISKLT